MKKKEQIQHLLDMDLPKGECRTVYQCPECKKIQAHDYIPYGMGFGRWINMCHCNAVSNNWIYGAKKLAHKDIREERSKAAKKGWKKRREKCEKEMSQ